MNALPIVGTLGIWACENNLAYGLPHLRSLGIPPTTSYEPKESTKRVIPQAKANLVHTMLYGTSTHEPVLTHYTKTLKPLCVSESRPLAHDRYLTPITSVVA